MRQIHCADVLREIIKQEKEKGNKIDKISFQVVFFSGDNDSVKTISYSGEELTTLN